MNKIIPLIILIAFIIVASIVSISLMISGFVWIGLLSSFLMALTVIIFTFKKAYPFRFMFPGLITFVLFMILPMIFTIYIGFTNLSTGHMLDQSAVYDILKKETHIPANAKSYRFWLVSNPENFTIYLQEEEVTSKPQTYLATFTFNDININLLPGKLPQNILTLTRGEVFQLHRELKHLNFILPDKKTLSYHRSTVMINTEKRFIPLEEKKLREITTGEIYYPDMETGLYTNGQISLAPGFYVNVGLKNFKKLFTNPSIKTSFLKIFIWTLIWGAGTVALTFTLGMFLALLVNNKSLRFKPLYRALLIIPYSIPFFISVLIFKGLLNKDFGIINEILATFGLPKLSWLGDPWLAKVSCLLVNLWLGFPYMFLVITGILQSIPTSVYEAASLDGAGRWATFKSITLPLIFSAVGPLLVGSFAFNLNNFVGIYLLTGGGPPIIGAITPAGETDILISYTYRLAFEGGAGQDFGMASSIAILIFVIITILTLINFKLSGMMKETK